MSALSVRVYGIFLIDLADQIELTEADTVALRLLAPYVSLKSIRFDGKKPPPTRTAKTDKSVLLSLVLGHHQSF